MTNTEKAVETAAGIIVVSCYGFGPIFDSDRQVAQAVLQSIRYAEMVEALEKIADGKVPPDQHGHYLAHRECIRLARSALNPSEG